MITGISVLKELSEVYIARTEEIDAAAIKQIRRIFIIK